MHSTGIQARALGLLGGQWKGSRGGPPGRRGALRGGRGGGAALRRSLNVIDHRPRKVFVQGMDEGDKENLQAHFAVSVWFCNMAPADLSAQNSQSNLTSLLTPAVHKDFHIGFHYSVGAIACGCNVADAKVEREEVFNFTLY